MSLVSAWATIELMCLVHCRLPLRAQPWLHAVRRVHEVPLHSLVQLGQMLPLPATQLLVCQTHPSLHSDAVRYPCTLPARVQSEVTGELRREVKR